MGKEIQSFVLCSLINLRGPPILRRHRRLLPRPHPLRMQQQVVQGKRSASGLQNHKDVDGVPIASLSIPLRVSRRRTDVTLVALKAISRVHARPRPRAMIQGRSLKARPRRRVLQELQARKSRSAVSDDGTGATTNATDRPHLLQRARLRLRQALAK